MIIQHNISALFVSNRLKAAEKAVGKSIARLSSGYRINSAADDAAGLAVSERMRAQINGLEQAEENVQNDISMVQTAEGGLNSIQNILQRMNTLAVESSNGTYQSGTDRANLQKEFSALKSEISQISTSTNFNEVNLLDGSLGTDKSNLKAAVELSNYAKAAGAFSFTDARAGVFSAAALAAPVSVTDGDRYSYTVNYVDTNGASKTAAVNMVFDSTNQKIKDDKGSILGTLFAHNAASSAEIGAAVKSALDKNTDFSNLFTTTNNNGALTFNAKTKGTEGGSVVGVTTNSSVGVPSVLSVTEACGSEAFEGTIASKLASYNGANANDAVFTVNGQKFAFVANGCTPAGLDSAVNTVQLTGALSAADVSKMSKLINDKTGLGTSANGTTIEYLSTSKATSTGGVVMQIGPDNKPDQRVTLSIGDMSTKGLGLENVSIATQADAFHAIDAVKAALKTVSEARADLGAMQNRLEYTADNLSTMRENLVSAESRIRDVDMGDEYVEYTKNMILTQIATALLVQANARQKNVLELLKS